MTEKRNNRIFIDKNYDIRITHNARWIDQNVRPMFCVLLPIAF